PPHPGRPYAQPHPGRPYAQPHPGQPYAQPHPGAPYPPSYQGQPYPAAGVPGAPRQRTRPPLAAPRRRPLPRWAAAFIAAALLVPGIGILASIAVPAVADQRSAGVWRATTISFPDALLGLPRRPELERQPQVRAMLRGLPIGARLA